ncbi:hypothetical protein [Rugamonas aquatica]|uniref:Lysozyme inhibitor LprI N-terminal domain-containing protein n=1 Tax=Rugamonas aquatica TaxID=2743357 RepID=A0A6A7N272_9BURK|nr:hypothetical protein [Rugamonas aquatica]MQA39133.1 hypothetical protein [Rugamonas aquatica]
MTTMKTTHRLLYTLLLATLGCASAHAAGLELSDCDILIGKKSNAAYKDWLKDNQKEADAGDRDAIRLRAIEAHNRLACYEEKLTGDNGWGMTMTSSDGSSETRQPPGIANIRKQPAAWRTLNQAVKYGHQAGAFDVGLKGASAELVVRYAAELPQQLEAAYEDAAAVYEYDCVLKRQFGRRDRNAGCASGRAARARLIPMVAAERRQALDASARLWAEQLPAVPKNQ